MDEAVLFKFAAALLLVMALIGAITVLVRRAGLVPRLIGRNGGQRRLSLIEFAAVDARRRLVLVRRDGVEHLLLLGPEHDLVIERGISAVPVSATTQAPSGGPEHAPL